MYGAKIKFRSLLSENEALYLWLAVLASFMLGLWQQPFINFETRFVVFAQEMLRHGPSLFPTTYGQPYPDYPVTSTILIWLFSLPFDQVTKFSAVFPTALASATVAAMTYKVFAQYSRKWGALAVGFEFLTVTFLADSRSISIDQMVSALTVSAFYLTHRSYRDGTALPIQQLMALLVAGFLIRGPVGVVIPAGVVISHLILTSKPKLVLSFAAWSAGVLIACMAIQIGLATVVYDKDFASELIRMQVFGRFTEASPDPKYYYFLSSFGNYALSYPVAMIVAVSILVRKFGKNPGITGDEHVRLVTLLMAWVAVVLIGLSIPETKKVRYILPVVPALAGLAGYLFMDIRGVVMHWIRRSVEALLFAIPCLVTIFLLLQRKHLIGHGLNPDVTTGVFLVLSLANVGIFAYFRRKAHEYSIAFVAMAVISAICLQIAIVEPIDLRIHDTGPFVRTIENLREQQPAGLMFYKENPDGLPIKYLVNVSSDLRPQFIDSIEQLNVAQLPAWLLTREKNLDDLKNAGVIGEAVIHRENFGDIPFVAVFLQRH